MKPDVLICAGLDPSGGAGLIADIRVASELGARPVGVITMQTVQNTTGVVDAQPVDPELLGHQLAFLMTDIEVRAVKIGMLGSLEIARAIAATLQLTGAPIVLDPVLAPSRGELPGAEFPFAEAILALGPHLTLITPNIPELAALTGLGVHDLASAEAAGRALANRLDTAVLVKGGHLAGNESLVQSLDQSIVQSLDQSLVQSLDQSLDQSLVQSLDQSIVQSLDQSIDLLIHRGGIEVLRAPRTSGGEHVHGTGCALSTAIATHLALGCDLSLACRRAKVYVGNRIANPVRPGRGAAAVV